MPADKDVSTVGSMSIDSLLKWLPILFAIIAFIFAFGRKDDRNEFLSQQTSALQTRVDGLEKDLHILADRVTKLEAVQDANQRFADQEKAYRDQLKK